MLTGTHLSTPGVEGASRAAMAAARAAGRRIALDIDYRPNLWGLTHLGAGRSAISPPRGSPRDCRTSCSSAT
ncbi:hypothetical protein ACFQU7_25235 [Pseudoroseomonas wenyumeiae]